MTATTTKGRAIVRVAAFLLLSIVAAEAAGLQPGPVSDDPIWTDKPVRIDRKTQDYERVKVERKVPPLTLKPTTRVTVFDSSSFQENGRLYVLTGAVAVNPKQLCRGDGGRIAACGQQARLFLKRLIAKRTLACREDFRMGHASFISCSVGEADLAETLVSRGAAWAATPHLDAAQQKAMAQTVGIWIDTQCRARGRCLPLKRR
jgi:endonuclease YncB( thermonuclease family)